MADETKEMSDVNAEADANAQRNRPKGWQKRVDHITKRFYETKSELERLQSENAALRQVASAGPVAFDDQTRAAIEARARQLALQHEAQNRFNNFQERVSGHLASQNDADELREKSKHIQIPGHVVPALVDDENGHKVVIHLARHPKEADALRRMAPHQAVAHIGKLSERLTRDDGKQERSPRISNAPPPVRTLGGSNKSADSLDDLAKRSYAEYKMAREASRRLR